jgi:DNA-binding beta-propeller fold protein YncE
MMPILLLIWLNVFSQTDVKTFGDFVNARSISFNTNEEIYICDVGTNKVQRFNSQGKLTAEVGGYGWKATQFDQPMQVAASDGLNLFIVDYNNNRVERYDKNLNYISTLKGEDDARVPQLLFRYPVSVAASVQGDLFILEKDANQVIRINPFSLLTTQFGGFGAGQGRFQDPYELEISRGTGFIYISDESLGRIEVFDAFGNFVMELGKGILKRPWGLFVSPAPNTDVAVKGERLYVVDSGEVFIFDTERKLLVRKISKAELAFLTEDLKDIAVTKDTLYLLTTKKVYAIKLEPEK